MLTLPTASDAVQVTGVSPMGKTVPDGGLQRTVIVPGQLSVATGVGNVTLASHAPASVLTTMLVGQAILGGSVSLTVTVNEQLERLPAPSVAVQVTVVVPVGKNEPDAGAHTKLTGSGQLSVAVGAGKVTTAPHWPGSLSFTIWAGQLPIAGSSVSRTMMWKLQVEVLPTASVAVQTTVLVPLGKLEPEGGSQISRPGLLSAVVKV